MSTAALVTPPPPTIDTTTLDGDFPRRIPRRPSTPAHRIRRERFRRRARLAGWVAFGLWAVVLGLYSIAIYNHFVLAEDFGQYNQAWTLIGRGHLNPFDTIYGFPFVRSNFELGCWPLALLHLVFPNPVVLLWVQDLSVAGIALVAYLWVLEVLDRARVTLWPTVLVAAAVIVVTLSNPATYATIAFEFHFEATGALFLVLAGRDLWRGRHARAWLFVGLTLLWGTFSSVALVGLGLSALLAGPRTRRTGVVLMVIGAAWIVLVAVLHLNVGSGVSDYAYLAGRTSLVGFGGMAALAGGILTHPARVIDHLRSRLWDIWFLIRPYGGIGLVSAWGLGVPVVVLLVSSLNSSANFAHPFQNVAVLPFLTVGTVMVLAWISSRLRPAALVAVVVGIGLLVQALTWGVSSSSSGTQWFVNRVSQPQAMQLQNALDRIPQDAEVIATESIVGRFCSRTYCYFFYPDLARPVRARTVVFVLDPRLDPTSPLQSERAASYIRDVLHARALIEADGIFALEWNPPPGTTLVTIPTLSSPRLT